MANYDILGNIAIVKFRREEKLKDKKKFALKLLKNISSIKTVLEKADRFKGRLRTIKTKYLAGDKTKEALYKENGCEFRLNVETCYFSPRLASERLEVAKMIKNNENVLVMFGGVAPFPIVISKLSKPKRILSVELGKECNNYAKINVKRNKVDKIIELVQGDVRKKIKGKEKFDRIVMARPNLKDPFLDVAFKAIKKNGIIHYYGFYKEEKLNELKELIEKESNKAKKKIKIMRIKKAGDIGPRAFRYRVDFRVLN